MKEMPVLVLSDVSDNDLKQETLKQIEKQKLNIKQLVILNQKLNQSEAVLLDIDSDIYEKQIINTDLSLDLNLTKINFFNKAVHDARRHVMLKLLKPESSLYNFFIDNAVDGGCIAIKQNKEWGFLFYTIGNNKYTFRFEPVHNVYENKKLKESDKGYRDFVYFLRSEALPKAYKIGRTDKPDVRLAQWRSSNPRDITRLLVVPDGRMEKVFHSRFNYCRIPGKTEWFEMDDELTGFINEQQNYRNRIIKEYKAL